MKTRFMICAVSAVILGSGYAYAADDSGVYVNVGASLIDGDTEQNSIAAASQSLSFKAVTGRLGYQLSEYIAVEGEVGFGLGSKDIDFSESVTTGGSPITGDFKVKNYYAIFARGILPVSENFDLFARVGYGQVDVKGSFTIFDPNGPITYSTSNDFDDALFGGGAQFNFTPNDGIRADYTKFDDANIFSLTYAREF